MRKIIFLLVLILFSFPSAFAIEYSHIDYCNNYDSTYTDWIEVGSSPYLDDTDGSYVYTNTDLVLEGNFNFPDYTNGTFIEVWIYLEMQGSSSRNDEVEIYVYNGTHNYQIEQDVDADSYQWYSYNITSHIDTWTKFNATRIYLAYDKVGSPATQDIYVRRAYLNVTYDFTAADLYIEDVNFAYSLSFTEELRGYFYEQSNLGYSLALTPETRGSYFQDVSFPFSLTLSPLAHRIIEIVTSFSYSLSLSPQIRGLYIEVVSFGYSLSLSPIITVIGEGISLIVYFLEGIDTLYVEGVSVSNGTQSYYEQFSLVNLTSIASSNYVFSDYHINVTGQPLNHTHNNPYLHNMSDTSILLSYPIMVFAVDYTPVLIWLAVICIMIGLCFISMITKIPILSLVVGIFTIIIGIYLIQSPPTYLTETLGISPLIQLLLIFIGIITFIFAPFSYFKEGRK